MRLKNDRNFPRKLKLFSVYSLVKAENDVPACIRLSSAAKYVIPHSHL